MLFPRRKKSNLESDRASHVCVDLNHTPTRTDVARPGEKKKKQTGIKVLGKDGKQKKE